MIKFLTGVAVGIVITSVGFAGIARILDRGVQTIQTHSQELAK